jgi:hypothetical protein
VRECVPVKIFADFETEEVLVEVCHNGSCPLEREVSGKETRWAVLIYACVGVEVEVEVELEFEVDRIIRTCVYMCVKFQSSCMISMSTPHPNSNQ